MYSSSLLSKSLFTPVLDEGLEPAAPPRGPAADFLPAAPPVDGLLLWKLGLKF